MKKIIKSFLLLITTFIFNMPFVMAAPLTQDECNSLLGDPTVLGQPAYYLQEILKIMRLLGIVLCIVLTVVDIFKALIGEEKDMYRPIMLKASKRFFYVVILFFLPSLVEVIMQLVGAYGTCNLK